MTFRALKNSLFLFLSNLLRKSSKRPQKGRFLVISTTGLGDSLWSSVAIFALKKKFPKATIELLTNPLGQEIFAHNPAISQIFVTPKHLLFSFYSLRKTLIEKNYQAACLLHSSQRWVLPLLSCSNIPQIIGTKNQQKGLDALLTDQVEDAAHEIERRGKIIEVLGAFIKDDSLQFFLQPEEILWAKNWMKNKKTPGKKNVLIHPGAKDSYKCWPEKNYIALAKKLSAEKNARIFISVGPEELSLGKRMQEELPSSVLLSGFSLRRFASILHQMDFVITNDTGPMHLACALKKLTLTLFCPTDTKRCGPYSVETAHVLARPRACTPCLKRSCRLPFCMRQISVEAAFEKACSLFAEIT